LKNFPTFMFAHRSSSGVEQPRFCPFSTIK
jgi:hypothetical protein